MESFSQLCNTAILRSGITGKHGIRDALARLVVTLIQHKDYQEFTLEQFVKDFAEFYKLRITSMLFEEIVPELRKLDVITSRGKRCYAVKKSRVAELNWLKDFMGFEAKRERLVEEFIVFSVDRIPDLSKAEAERILTAFIENTISSLGTDAPSNEGLSGEEEYVVSSFFAAAKAERKDLYETIENITVGRMLASFITSSGRGRGTNIPELTGMSIYFDSAFLIYLLGLDNYSTPLEYIQLTAALRDMGVKLKVFDHTFNEVYEIIHSTLYWINNPDYSWEKSSAVNQFFLSNKFTREEVEEFLFTLKTKLKKMDIIIEDADIDYNERDSIYQADIKRKIIDEYKKNGGYNEEKDGTYELDAKSLYAIHKRRRYKTIHRLQDSQYLFLTTNRAIARVSKLVSSAPDESPAVPLAITDTFMSVLLFFACPSYSGAINERFCIPAAFHAFEPDKELVRKVETVLSNLQKDNLILPADAFAWKTNTVLSEYIVRFSGNNPDNFTENAPEKIIELIQKDADERVRRSEEKTTREIEIAQKAATEKVEMARAEAESAIEEERRKVNNALGSLERVEKEKQQLSSELCKKYIDERKRCDSELRAIQRCIEKRAKYVSWILSGAIFVLAIAVLALAIWFSSLLLDMAILIARTVSYCISAMLMLSSVYLSPIFNWGRFKPRMSALFTKRHQNEIDSLTRQIDECDRKINSLEHPPFLDSGSNLNS